MTISRETQNQLLDLLLKLPQSGSNIPASSRIDALLFGLPESLVRTIPKHDDTLAHLSAIITHLNRWAEVEERTEVIVALIDNALRATDSKKLSAGFASLRQRIVESIESLPLEYTPAKTSGFERQIVSASELVSQSMLVQAVKAGRSVARLKFSRVESGKSTDLYGLGTGWLISPELLLTNHHVIALETDHLTSFDLLDSQTKTGVAWFDYNTYDGLHFEYTCRQLISFDVALDYALIRLDTVCKNHPSPPLSQWNYLPVYQERPALTQTSRLNIIQHPGGTTKKYGIRSNHFSGTCDSDSPYVQYTTHTEAGSSGSPVFDDNWKVVAIHHQWVEVKEHPYQGEVVRYHNQGVYVDRILKDIALRDPIVHEEILSAQKTYQ